MRILVDVKEHQLQQLDQLAKREKQSRAALIRQAVAEFLERRRAEQAADAFGLWGKRKIDGLAYQKNVRNEW